MRDGITKSDLAIHFKIVMAKNPEDNRCANRRRPTADECRKVDMAKVLSASHGALILNKIIQQKFPV